MPKDEFDQLKCKHCLKVMGWGKCSCAEDKGLIETICAECYIQQVANRETQENGWSMATDEESELEDEFEEYLKKDIPESEPESDLDSESES